MHTHRTAAHYVLGRRSERHRLLTATAQFAHLFALFLELPLPLQQGAGLQGPTGSFSAWERGGRRHAGAWQRLKPTWKGVFFALTANEKPDIFQTVLQRSLASPGEHHVAPSYSRQLCAPAQQPDLHAV